MKTLAPLLLVLAAQTGQPTKVSYPDKILGIIPQDCEIRATVVQLSATQYRVQKIVQACGDTLLWGLRDTYSKNRLCRKVLNEAGVPGVTRYADDTAVAGRWDTYTDKPSIGELTCETDTVVSDNCTVDIADLYRQEVFGKVGLQRDLEDKGYSIVNGVEEAADFKISARYGYVDEVGGVRQWRELSMKGQEFEVKHKSIEHDIPIIYAIEESLKTQRFSNYVPYCIKKEK